MKTAVRYYSRSGNTQKLAEAIAKALGTAAEIAEVPIAEPVDLLFIGGALYAGNMDEQLKKLAKSLTGEIVKRVAVFSTAASGKPLQPKVKELLEGKGIVVLDETFAGKGKFLLANKGRPDDSDCEAAAAFAKKLTGRQ